MATKLEKIKWSLYQKKRKLFFDIGLKNGLIQFYDEELIENLRNVYFGGLPASIVLLCPFLCAGHCYDYAVLMSFGFGNDDFNLVYADIDVLKLNPKYIDEMKTSKNIMYAEHCFAERTKADGTTWVYDTTVGLAFEKNFYYKLEKPHINSLNNKQQVSNYDIYHYIKIADINEYKQKLPRMIHYIEEHLKIDNNIIYREILEKEIELLKKEIEYDKVKKVLSK